MEKDIFTRKGCKYKNKNTCTVTKMFCLSVVLADCKKAQEEGNAKKGKKPAEKSLSDDKDVKQMEKMVNRRGGIWEDHEGTVYPTLKAMLEKWHVTERTYYNRLNKGLSIKEVLTGVWNGLHSNDGVWTDHKGNTYKYKKDMCAAYDVTVPVFSKRIKLGWTLREALEGRSKGDWTDIEGEHFDYLEDMLDKWNVAKSSYYLHKSQGWTLEQILKSGRESKNRRTSRNRDGLDYEE